MLRKPRFRFLTIILAMITLFEPFVLLAETAPAGQTSGGGTGAKVAGGAAGFAVGGAAGYAGVAAIGTGVVAGIAAEAAFAVVAMNAGAAIAGEIARGVPLKEAISSGLNKINWAAVTGQTIGVVAGTLLGSLLPIPGGWIVGAVIGGFLGDWIAKKIVALSAAKVLPGNRSPDASSDAKTPACTSSQSASPKAGSPKIKVTIDNHGNNPYSD